MASWNEFLTDYNDEIVNWLTNVDYADIDSILGIDTNTAPVAVADTFATEYATAVTVDVLANDTDADGDTLTISAATVDAAVGTVSVVDDAILFTPADGVSGDVSFTYTVSDGNGGTATAAVTGTVGEASLYTDVDINADDDGIVTGDDTVAESFNFTPASGNFEVNSFDTVNDILTLDLDVTSDVTSLADLDGLVLASGDVVSVQVNEITGDTLVTMGLDSSGEIISLDLIGVSSPADVVIDVI